MSTQPPVPERQPDPACTCQPIIRRGRPPEPAVDPECPVHGWQDAGLAAWHGVAKPRKRD